MDDETYRFIQPECRTGCHDKGDQPFFNRYSVFAGIGMVSKCGTSYRNLIIVSLSLSVGLGFTQTQGLLDIFPPVIRSVFAENCVAVTFLMAVVMNLILPKETE